MNRGYLPTAASIIASVVISDARAPATADDAQVPPLAAADLVPCSDDEPPSPGALYGLDSDGDGVLDRDALIERDLDRDGMADATKDACDRAEVLVLIDRSWSMEKHGHYDAAVARIDRVVERAGTEDVQIVGFPSPPATPTNGRAIDGLATPKKTDRCRVRFVSERAQVRNWPRPNPRDKTPLLQAIAAAGHIVTSKPAGVWTRLLVITDGFQDCGGGGKAYKGEALAKAVAEALGPAANLRMLTAPEIQHVSKDRTAAKEAADLQAALERLFEREACKKIEDGPPELPPEWPETLIDDSWPPIDGPTPRPPPPPVPPPFDPPPPVPPPLDPPPPPRYLLPPPAEFVDVVAVGRGDQWGCSGVIVGDVLGRPARHATYVLTAKHCLPATDVAIGGSTARSGLVLAVAEAIAHPDPSVDVALLRLERRLERRTHSYRVAGDDSPPAGHLRVVGFGADDPSGLHGAGDIHIADLPAHGWGCDRRSAASTGCVPGHELVIRGNAGLDACRGDSGGPVFERVGCDWRLVAITSRAIAAARHACGDGGVYTRLDAIAGWIQYETEQP